MNKLTGRFIKHMDMNWVSLLIRMRMRKLVKNHFEEDENGFLGGIIIRLLFKWETGQKRKRRFDSVVDVLKIKQITSVTYFTLNIS